MISHSSLPEHFLNRELSWLAFNERVLEEAADPTNPLLERVKFVAIVGVEPRRVLHGARCAVRHAVSDGEVAPDPAGLTPSQQLRRHRPARARAGEGALRPRARRAPARARRARRQLRALERGECGPADRARHVLPRGRAAGADAAGDRLVAPVPAALVAEPQPRAAPRGARPRRPAASPSCRSRPASRVWSRSPSAAAFVLLEEIVRAHLAELFPGQRDPRVRGHPAVARRRARAGRRGRPDAAGDRRARAAPAAARRRHRASKSRSARPRSCWRTCARELDIDQDDVYVVPGLLDLRVLMQLRRSPGVRGACGALPAAGGSPEHRAARRPVLGARRARPAAPPSVRGLRPGRRARGAGRRRPGRPRHQADALPDQRRLADHRGAAARGRAQQAGHRPGRAHRPLRRGAEHPLGARPRGSRRARDLRRARVQDARQDLPRRAAAPRGPAPLRAPRHRQLQRAHGAHLHGLQPADDVARDCRGRVRVLQRDHGLLGSAAAEEARDGADRAPATVRAADRTRASPRGGGPAGRDRREDELAHRRGDHRRALRRVAERGDHPAQHPRDLRAAAGHSRSQRAHRGRVDRGPLPRARARSITSTTAATTRSTWRAPTG